MSNLRDNLDRAKADYHSAQYPGDLASELLPLQIVRPAAVTSQKVTQNRWFWAFGSSSAVAASMIAAFMFSSAAPTPSPSIGAGPSLEVARLELAGAREPAPDSRFPISSPRATFVSSPDVNSATTSPQEEGFLTLDPRSQNSRNRRAVDYTVPPR